MRKVASDFNKEELLEAYDIVSKLLAEACTPEAVAEAERFKEEHIKVINDLGDAIDQLEGIMGEKFPDRVGQVQFWVPHKRPRRRDRLVIMEFDGEKLKANFNGQKPLPLKHNSLQVRMGACEAIPLLFNQLRTKYRWQTALSA